MKAIELAKLLEEKTPIEILEQLAQEAQDEADYNDRQSKRGGLSLRQGYQFGAMMANERLGAYQLAISILKAAGQ